MKRLIAALFVILSLARTTATVGAKSGSVTKGDGT